MIDAVAYRTYSLLGAAASAQGPSNTDVMRVMMWIGVMIALLVLVGAGIMMYRKRMFGAESQIDAAGSMFDELRRLHREGLMSQEEYDIARKKVATRASEAMDRRAAERKAQKKNGGGRAAPRRKWTEED